ncbi:MAG: CPBP family intramembrane metalloprotease [Bacteroidetes bacterium]|nr:CPBP family intramembrane metalloprotease [Bacteroidota bacterium]
MLIVAITIGIFTYDRVNLSLPVIESFIDSRVKAEFKNIIIFGFVGGIIAGLLMILVGESFSKILPDDLSHLSQDVKPTIVLRLLYGGLTEEILMRFGVMTLMVWSLSLLINKKYTIVYWLGIILSSFIFALGHFPIVFNTMENPSFLLLTYILVGNSAGGIIFGWLYWKKGLESAFIAHMFAHITMIIGEYLFYIL